MQRQAHTSRFRRAELLKDGGRYAHCKLPKRQDLFITQSKVIYFTVLTWCHCHGLTLPYSTYGTPWHAENTYEDFLMLWIYSGQWTNVWKLGARPGTHGYDDVQHGQA